jgi:quercetin dioxygenase-like cupin family protein
MGGEVVSDSAARGERAAAPGVIVLGPGEGRTIPASDVITLKATGEQTGGSIGFLEATTPPGAGPPRHIHHGADELFYVLEGQFQFLAGERVASAPPGTFVFIPRGTVHAAKNVGTEPGRLLAAFIPGGVEGSFEAFAQLPPEQGGDPDRAARVRAVAEQYESEFVGPPL